MCDRYTEEIDDNGYMPNFALPRVSEDTGCYAQGNRLLDLCKATGLLMDVMDTMGIKGLLHTLTLVVV